MNDYKLKNKINMEVRELEKNFTKKHVDYQQVFSNDEWYIYQCTSHYTEHQDVYYEVFKRKVGRTYDNAGLCVYYPTDECFGKWAWCVTKFERAMWIVNNRKVSEE